MNSYRIFLLDLPATQLLTFHFTMHILRNANSNTKGSAYTPLVRQILEYGEACWDAYKEGQINELDRV
jgi:hypothetical protein